jgi:hypothetical protein
MHAASRRAASESASQRRVARAPFKVATTDAIGPTAVKLGWEAREHPRIRAKGVCSAMTAETRRRVKAGLPGRERLSALHENRAPVRDGGALVLGGSAAGEVDALDRVASSGQGPQERDRDVLGLVRAAHVPPRGRLRRGGADRPPRARSGFGAFDAGDDREIRDQISPGRPHDDPRLAPAPRCQKERLGVSVCGRLRRRVAAFGVSG